MNSKIMESDELMKIVEYKFHHLYFIIDIIINGDDGTIISVISHLSRGAHIKPLKPSK